MAEQALEYKSKERDGALFLPNPVMNQQTELNIQRSSFNSTAAFPDLFLLKVREVDYSQLTRIFTC